MARLGDVCIQITDGSHNPPMGVEQSNYLMLSSKNIDDDHITFNDPRYLSQEDFEAENKRTNIKPNDLLITIVGTIGRVAIVPNSLTEFCVQRSVAVLKPKPEMVYNRFLMYYLQNMRPYLEQESRGVAQKGIYLKQLSNLSIILPPLDEQRKIAAVLDKVSDLIAKRRQQLDKLDELIKARFVEMFGDQDYPYKELISLIKEGAGLSYGIVQPGDDGTGDMGVLRPVDLIDGKIDTTSIKYIDRSIGEGFKKTELHGNELLITVRGTTGITALTDDRFIGMNVTRGIAVIRYDSEKINPVYLNTYLKTDKSQRYIQERTRGATLQQINLSDLRVQQILVPPRDEQEQFAAFVEQTEKTKTTISKSLEKLETLKKALMQEYFG